MISADDQLNKDGINILAHWPLQNNEITFNTLLKAGIDINAAAGLGFTALEDAIRTHKPEKAKWLIEHGYDLNKKHRNKTIFDFLNQYFSYKRDEKDLKFWLELINQAKPNQKDQAAS